MSGDPVGGPTNLEGLPVMVDEWPEPAPEDQVSVRQTWAVIAVLLLAVGIGVFRMSEGWPSGVGSAVIMLGVGALILAGVWDDLA